MHQESLQFPRPSRLFRSIGRPRAPGPPGPPLRSMFAPTFGASPALSPVAALSSFAFDLLFDDGCRNTTPVKNAKRINKMRRYMIIFLTRRDESLKQNVKEVNKDVAQTLTNKTKRH